MTESKNIIPTYDLELSCLKHMRSFWERKMLNTTEHADETPTMKFFICESKCGGFSEALQKVGAIIILLTP